MTILSIAYHAPLAAAILDLDLTLVFQFGIFIILFILLRVLLFTPVVKLIDARREATIGSKEQAATMNSESEALLDKIHTELMDIRTAAAAERARAVEQARRQGRAIEDETRTKCQALVAPAETQIKDEAAKVESDLRQSLASLTHLAAETILGRAIAR